MSGMYLVPASASNSRSAVADQGGTEPPGTSRLTVHQGGVEPPARGTGGRTTQVCALSCNRALCGMRVDKSEANPTKQSTALHLAKRSRRLIRYVPPAFAQHTLFAQRVLVDGDGELRVCVCVCVCVFGCACVCVRTARSTCRQGNVHQSGCCIKSHEGVRTQA